MIIFIKIQNSPLNFKLWFPPSNWIHGHQLLQFFNPQSGSMGQRHGICRIRPQLCVVRIPFRLFRHFRGSFPRLCLRFLRFGQINFRLPHFHAPFTSLAIYFPLNLIVHPFMNVQLVAQFLDVLECAEAKLKNILSILEKCQFGLYNVNLALLSNWGAARNLSLGAFNLDFIHLST